MTKSKDQEIMVCREHDTPLIWTFVFPYAEYFCMKGNHAMGMMEAGYRVESTPELRKLLALYKKRFDALKQDIALGKFERTGCPLCVGEAWHTQHLTEKEIKASAEALKKLEGYANEA